MGKSNSALAATSKLPKTKKYKLHHIVLKIFEKLDMWHWNVEWSKICCYSKTIYQDSQELTGCIRLHLEHCWECFAFYEPLSLIQNRWDEERKKSLQNPPCNEFCLYLAKISSGEKFSKESYEYFEYKETLHIQHQQWHIVALTYLVILARNVRRYRHIFEGYKKIPCYRF